MLIDSHCHFDFAPFIDAPEHYLTLAKNAGVKRIIIPSVGERNWHVVEQLSRQFDELYYALGLHPFFSHEHSEHALPLLKERLQKVSQYSDAYRKKCVAIGECGLDFAIVNADKEQQIELLSEQITLANQFDLPVILHCRKAFPELMAVLRRNSPIAGGVYHAFSGSYQQAKQLIDLGIKIGVGGTITYSRASKTRHTIASLPLVELILETDAPDMPISGFQGEPNRPDRICNILRTLASIRMESELVIEEVTTLTTAELFCISL